MTGALIYVQNKFYHRVSWFWRVAFRQSLEDDWQEMLNWGLKS